MGVEENYPRIVLLLEQVAPQAPQVSLKQVYSLLRHRERRVALETLCVNLEDGHAILDAPTKSELVAICRVCGVDSTYWGQFGE